jgi:hypothetical protein
MSKFMGSSIRMYGTLLAISLGSVTWRGLEDVLSDGQSNRELCRGHMKARRQPSNSGITDIPLFLSETTRSRN